jgi:long-chain acyl-CoA synthetase
VALVWGDERISFRRLNRAANAMAGLLAAHGVGAGHRVAVLLGNGPDAFATWYGAARRGALVVPVSTRLTAPEASYIVSDSGATVLVHDNSAVAGATVEATGVAGLTVEAPVWNDGADEPPDDTYLGSPVTTMSYTSGTTGRPKGITRVAPAPAREAAPNPYAAFWGLRPHDVHLMAGPGYHMAPAAYAQMSLNEGGTVVVMARFDATEALRLIERERVTTAQMVPAHFIRLLEADWPAYDRSSVRKVLHAAAPCPVPVKRRIIDLFPPGAVWEFYGASEGMASVISPEEWLAKPGSVGRPFPGLSVRILDEDGTELPPGEVGSIYISPFAGQRFGYHNDAAKTDGAWRDGHFTVGDMGWLDDDGYLFLADRRTDLILSGGVNVYPAEVETALAEDPAVVDAAVFGLPDERMGQRVHAVVELRPGQPRDADGLGQRLAGRLADYKRPRTIEFVDVLPREENGKVMKARLRAQRMEPAPAGQPGEARP